MGGNTLTQEDYSFGCSGIIPTDRFCGFGGPVVRARRSECCGLATKSHEPQRILESVGLGEFEDGSLGRESKALRVQVGKQLSSWLSCRLSKTVSIGRVETGRTCRRNWGEVAS